jgi:signal transduction histidine kinase
VAVDSPQPATAVLRTREPLWLESLEALRARYPHLADAQPLHGNRSWAAVPLLVHGRAVGSLLLSFAQQGALAPEDRTFLLALAQKCGQALERAHLVHELRGAVRLRDDFLSVASHELKTPLTPLQLRLQMLRREAQDPSLPADRLRERVGRAVDGAEAQVHKLATLVNDLLDVARIGAGKLRLERTRVDLAVLVREVAARLAPQLHKAGCPLALDVPDSLVGLWDEQRLEQVVVNLLTNALKYGAGKPVHLRLAAEEGRARLTVRDEGIGIAPEDQARIFERFERAVSDRHFGGLGLGLYICRQILEALGGTIGVRSAPEQGATFEVTLPTVP